MNLNLARHPWGFNAAAIRLLSTAQVFRILRSTPFHLSDDETADLLIIHRRISFIRTRTTIHANERMKIAHVISTCIFVVSRLLGSLVAGLLGPVRSSFSQISFLTCIFLGHACARDPPPRQHNVLFKTLRLFFWILERTTRMPRREDRAIEGEAEARALDVVQLTWNYSNSGII